MNRNWVRICGNVTLKVFTGISLSLHEQLQSGETGGEETPASSSGQHVSVHNWMVDDGGRVQVRNQTARQVGVLKICDTVLHIRNLDIRRRRLASIKPRPFFPPVFFGQENCEGSNLDISANITSFIVPRNILDLLSPVKTQLILLRVFSITRFGRNRYHQVEHKNKMNIYTQFMWNLDFETSQFVLRGYT